MIPNKLKEETEAFDIRMVYIQTLYSCRHNLHVLNVQMQIPFP